MSQIRHVEAPVVNLRAYTGLSSMRMSGTDLANRGHRQFHRKSAAHRDVSLTFRLIDVAALPRFPNST